MQDVFLLQAWFAALVLILEVPSGYLGDMLGRRNTLLLGVVFSGLGHTVLLGAEGFWSLALFEACLAVAHSMISGADLALVYDTELALGKSEDEQMRVIGRLQGIRSASEAVAGVVATLVLLYGTLADVVLLQFVVGWLPLLAALRLVEPPRERMTDGQHLANMARVLRHMWHSHRILRLTLVAFCIWSLTTFYAVWLLQKLWELQGIELHHFGYLWAAMMLIATVASHAAHRVESWVGPKVVLVFAAAAPIAAYLGLAWFGVVGGLIAATLFFVARGLGLVLLKDALNRRVPSEFRATANSIASFGFRASFVATGPFVGWAFDIWGMQEALYLLAGFSAVVLAFVMMPLVRSIGTGVRTEADAVV